MPECTLADGRSAQTRLSRYERLRGGSLEPNKLFVGVMRVVSPGSLFPFLSEKLSATGLFIIFFIVPIYMDQFRD